MATKKKNPVRRVGAVRPKKAAMPKVIGRQKAQTKGKSLAKNPAKKRSRVGAINDMRSAKAVYEGFRKARPNRYKSRVLPKSQIVPIDGRHYPSSGRYKTGWHRAVREPWMTDSQWRVIKAIVRMPEKWMSKSLKNVSLGDKFYGKKGPGHAGYGTGAYQNWSDYILRQNQGLDPHKVSFYHLFKNAAEAFAYHNGGEDFKARMKGMKDDPESSMRLFLEKLKSEIPELAKASKRDIQELMEHRDYLATFGPDGRMK